MISLKWIEKRKPYWDRLEAIVVRARKGIADLPHDELRELALLYRQTASDLPSVRQDPSSAPLEAYLNQLLSRSHNLIYLGQRPKSSGMVGFYRDTWPRVFRETLPATTLATAVFIAAALAGWAK